ncbi:hypothetical protein LCGC14_2416610 [marine sediment metagenome]|uniref:DUF1320 domain-containing protein n=1 Tax=marine sediment metagenome TaxID=412755 RepID=A0A0F9EKB1_9ZZZZ
MPYSTLDDIKKLLPEDTLITLTDDEGLGQVDTARVDEAIAQADSEIDSYCGGRYSVPVSPAPAILKKLSVDIAIYTLYSRIVQEMPEIRTERYKTALKQLDGIARGTISLGVAAAPDPADQGSGAETNLDNDSQTFTRDKLEGF